MDVERVNMYKFVEVVNILWYYVILLFGDCIFILVGV